MTYLPRLVVAWGINAAALWAASALWDGVQIIINGTPVEPIDPLYLHQKSVRKGGKLFGQPIEYDIEAAAKAWQEAARLAAEAKQPQAHSRALTHLAQAYAALGHYSEAADSLHAALTLAEPAGDRTQVALVLAHLGDVAVATGDLAAADQRLRVAVAGWRASRRTS